MRILITGGAANGKSSFAEKLALRLTPPWTYIASMKPYGEESLARIARHQAARAGKGFRTIERYEDIGGLTIQDRGTVLFECMCNLTANELFDNAGMIRPAYDRILAGMAALEAQCADLIVVTNDVGSDGSRYEEKTRLYVETLGRLNQALAQRYEVVAEMVCGIPIWLKGDPV